MRAKYIRWSAADTWTGRVRDDYRRHGGMTWAVLIREFLCRQIIVVKGQRRRLRERGGGGGGGGVGEGGGVAHAAVQVQPSTVVECNLPAATLENWRTPPPPQYMVLHM